MAVVAGAAPTALWHTAHCRLCEPVWATGRRACRAGCLGLSMFCPFCRVCVRCYGGCTDLDLDRTSGAEVFQVIRVQTTLDGPCWSQR